MTEVRDLIIIGGGPAGYTAALYAAQKSKGTYIRYASNLPAVCSL